MLSDIMNNNQVEMAVWHPEGVACLEWEEEVKAEAPDEIGEEMLQVVKGEAEQVEGLKNEGPVLDGAEDVVDPYDDTNLNFEVDEEGNVFCPADTSSDGSLLDLGVSLLLPYQPLVYPSASQDMEAYYNGGGGDLSAPLDIAAVQQDLQHGGGG